MESSRQPASGDGGEMPPTGSAEVDGLELVACLEVGLADALAEMSDGEVAEALAGLVVLSGRVQLALARVLDSFDTRNLAAVDGAKSPAGWVAARSELSRPAAGRMVKVGRGLRACPVVDRAGRSGRLGEAKIGHLLAARRGVEDLFAEHEASLVAMVEPLTVAHAATAIAHWRRMALEHVGGDGDPDPEGDREANRVHLSRVLNGRWRLDGDLDGATGESLAAALENWIDRRVRDGSLHLGPEAPRSHQRAEALAALISAGAESPGGGSGTQPRVGMKLVWDAADLLGQPISDLAHIAQRACDTDRATPMSRLAASVAMCNADVADLICVFGLGDTRHVLGVTHTRRYPTAKEREALDVRDRGCVFPGCDAPPRWCDAHHTVEYQIGRRTRLDELVLLCPFHHRQVHQGFALARSVNGHIHVARPDGTRLSPESCDGSVVDRRHKLPATPRFSPRVKPPDPVVEPEPFDPVYQALTDTLAHRRLDGVRLEREPH